MGTNWKKQFESGKSGTRLELSRRPAAMIPDAAPADGKSLKGTK